MLMLCLGIAAICVSAVVHGTLKANAARALADAHAETVDFATVDAQGDQVVWTRKPEHGRPCSTRLGERRLLTYVPSSALLHDVVSLWGDAEGKGAVDPPELQVHLERRLARFKKVAGTRWYLEEGNFVVVVVDAGKPPFAHRVKMAMENAVAVTEAAEQAAREGRGSTTSSGVSSSSGSPFAVPLGKP